MAGIASRRAAEKHILRGDVMVNGVTVTQLGTIVTPGRDAITVAGRPVTFTDPPLTLMLNKPPGYICSMDNAQGPTVFLLLREIPQRLFSAGRLDKNSEGLLLLTNDGELANRLMHPRYGHTKIYEVTIAGGVSPSALERLNGPMTLDGIPIQPVRVTRKAWHCKLRQTTLEFTLREGRNRQIRKMCETVGLRILRLCRTQVGALNLGSLASGRYRALTAAEMHTLIAPPRADG